MSDSVYLKGEDSKSISADTSIDLLLFPCARQADTGSSKQGKTILQLSPSILPVWQGCE